jgi:hypothetical protein
MSLLEVTGVELWLLMELVALKCAKIYTLGELRIEGLQHSW